jgi:hypothetical protein
MNTEHMISQHDEDTVIKKSWGGANSILAPSPNKPENEDEDSKNNEE